MKTFARILTLALALTMFAAVAYAAEVVQGKCIENNAAAKTITVEEYDLNFSKEHPYGMTTGVQSTYDVKTAKLGIPAEPGDILRIAYDAQGEKRVALKVMNVSKQDLRKK